MEMEKQMAFHGEKSSQLKLIVEMPAYHAAYTIKITRENFPHQAVEIILADGRSTPCHPEESLDSDEGIHAERMPTHK
jgi:hypothetical protein